MRQNRSNSFHETQIIRHSFSCQTDIEAENQRIRKNSEELGKTIKKLPKVHSLENKINYKISTQHLVFLMEQQRLQELNSINQSQQLAFFYKCFNSMFMMIYQASQMIANNMFGTQQDAASLRKINFIAALISEFSSDWNQAKYIKLQTLAANVMKMASTAVEFQRRIEFVSRKICIHNEKQHQIEHAFLNQKLKDFWQKLLSKINQNVDFSYIEENYTTNSEKLCYMDVQNFVMKILSSQAFSQKLSTEGKYKEIDEDLNFNFTFEFLLIEQFCVTLSQKEDKTIKEKLEEACEIM